MSELNKPNDFQEASSVLVFFRDLGFPEFRVKLKEKYEDDYGAWISMTVLVEECAGWTDTEETSDFEPYLEAYIKWDGCSHFYFGNIAEYGNGRDSYIHVCGKRSFEDHMMLMHWLWESARKTLSNFNEDRNLEVNFVTSPRP